MNKDSQDLELNKAPQAQVTTVLQEVKDLLGFIGIESVFVSDESYVADYVFPEDEFEKLGILSLVLGRQVRKDERILDLAKEYKYKVGVS